MPEHNSFRSSTLSLPLVQVANCDALSAKFVANRKEKYQRETSRLFYRRSNADFVEQASAI
jgi:hypothetical protein